MSIVQLFENDSLNLSLTTVVNDSGEIFFKAKEVATVLGYVNTSGAFRDHVDDEFKIKISDIRKGSEMLPLLKCHPDTVL